jgi:hypothetical protein
MRHGTRSDRAVIAVCGSSRLDDDELERLAEALGAEIVRAGMSLVTGGMGGVMSAASRGAATARDSGEGDGLVIGILPGTRKDEANPYCDVILPTGMGSARNALVVLAADAVVVFHGGAGTLSEVALAWQAGKPIVALVPSGGWAGRLGGQRIDATQPGIVLSARTPSEAVALLRDELSGLR